MPGISGRFRQGDYTFEYNEERCGGTNRGISVRCQATGRYGTYKLQPNPHHDAWYNKNQETFYANAGSALATLFISRGGSFPRYGDASIKVNAIDYRLEEDS